MCIIKNRNTVEGCFSHLIFTFRIFIYQDQYQHLILAQRKNGQAVRPDFNKSRIQHNVAPASANRNPPQPKFLHLMLRLTSSASVVTHTCSALYQIRCCCSSYILLSLYTDGRDERSQSRAITPNITNWSSSFSQSDADGFNRQHLNFTSFFLL